MLHPELMTERDTLKLGDRLFTGAIITSPSAVEAYNNMTQEIREREAQGLPVRESLLNGRHNLLMAMAYVI